jgi:peptide/nickel transport system permease protein
MTAAASSPAGWRWLLGLLAFVYLVVLAAGFVAPYDPLAQDREFPYAPPTRLRFTDATGRWHLRPFAYRLARRTDAIGHYEEDRNRAYPIRVFVRGAPYEIAGLFVFDRHLFGTESPTRVFVLGTDEYGRDLFSRFLHGGQISLLAGLLGAGLSLALGVLLGTVAGFYGSWADEAIMRLGELFLALPWLYLLLAVRMMLPLHIDPGQTFLLLVAVVALVGWARPARLVRGLVLSARMREYVLAARSFGASDLQVLWRHVLPQLRGIALTQAALLVPQFTLAEVTLSFFGLGVGEPVPSWGNLLASLQRYHVLTSYWWMFLPAFALIPVFLLYYLLADSLHRRAPFSL